MMSTKIFSPFDFVDALAILFIALKLCGVIDWSWWWVLSPLWIDFIVVMIIGMLEDYARKMEAEAERKDK